jgi:hypothetical protein
LGVEMMTEKIWKYKKVKYSDAFLVFGCFYLPVHLRGESIMASFSISIQKQ